jgi:bile-salt sulfotransferase
MDKYIKIYSHPRSGTHFLEAFLASNFYKNKDLSSNGDIYYGHWSNKILLEGGEPYHKLFGSHFFPEDTKINSKGIYIYRDGRAVIASIWNSGFYHKEWKGMTFSEFLRKDIDWYGGLGQEKYPEMNIVQHWYHHALKWHELKSDEILYIRFEDLKTNPHKIYLEITKKFMPLKYLKAKMVGVSNLDPIKNKVGLAPNKANIDSWKNLYSKEDLDFFYSQLPSKKFLHEL